MSVLEPKLENPRPNNRGDVCAFCQKTDDTHFPISDNEGNDYWICDRCNERLFNENF